MSNETIGRPEMGFRQRRITKFLRDVALNYEALGSENLNRVRQLLDEGKIVGAILDHKSYADFGSGSAVVVKEGLEDLVGRARVVMATKYKDKLLIKLFVNAVAGAMGLKIQWVVSHTMDNDKREQAMNSEAIENIQNEEDGRVDIVTPEGTRSKDGKMQPARWGAANFWHGAGERYILPIAMEGSENQWPRGVGGTIYYFRKGRKEHQIKVIFGEPVPVDYLDKVAEAYAQGNPEKLISLRVDIPMLLIANLHKTCGDSKYTEGYYQDLSEELFLHPVSVSLRDLRNLGEIKLSPQKEEPQESVTEEKKISSWPVLRFDPGLT